MQKSFNLSTEGAENIIGSEKLPEQDPKGNGETQQNPFSEDCFNLDEWKESDHPRNKEGEFTNGNGSSTPAKNETFEKDVEKVLENAVNKGDNRLKVDVGEVSQKLTEEAKKNGFDIAGYKHNVDVSGVQHAFKHHGIGNETEKGQIPITDDDIKKIPDIVYNYDKVTFGTKDKKGTDVIKYQKQMPDGEIYYLEEIRTGKKSLTIKTMYKKSR